MPDSGRQVEGCLEMPDQIGKEQHRAVEQRHHYHFAAAVVALNLARQRPDAPGQLRVGEEDTFNFLAPARRDGRGKVSSMVEGEPAVAWGREISQRSSNSMNTAQPLGLS